VWLAFFRRRPEVAALEELLLENVVTAHEYVVAELTLRLLDDRSDRLLSDVRRLVDRKPRSHADMLDFVRRHRLEGSGISYVDAHALASAEADGLLLWSLDSKAQEVAERLELAFRPKAR
jgi:hypothetical protein